MYVSSFYYTSWFTSSQKKTTIVPVELPSSWKLATESNLSFGLHHLIGLYKVPMLVLGTLSVLDELKDYLVKLKAQ